LRRQRQDLAAGVAHPAPAARRGRAGRDPRHHLHAQGGARDRGAPADWLRLLAVGSDDEVRDFLPRARVAAGADRGRLLRARGLYEQVLSAQPPLTVSTFHGWFARLVQGAPLSSDLAGFVLHESGARLRRRCGSSSPRCGRRNDAAAAALLWLLQHDRSGGDAQAAVRTVRSPRRMAGPCRRGAAAAERALAALRECLGVGEEPAAVDQLLADELFMRKLHDYAGILRRSELESDQQQPPPASRGFVGQDAGNPPASPGLPRCC
jgi:hypothetical protein